MAMLQMLTDLLVVPVRAVMAAPLALASGPKRFLGLSLPTRVALLFGLALLVGAICVRAALTSTQLAVDPWVYLRDWLAILALVVAISFATRYALHCWLDEQASPFPDIDEAWKQGTTALVNKGLRLEELPIFLVLGCHDESQVEHLHRSSGLGFSVGPMPAGAGALHWHGNERAVFLSLTHACALNQQVASPDGDGLQPFSPSKTLGGGESPAPPQPFQTAGGPAFDLRGTYKNVVDYVRGTRLGPEESPRRGVKPDRQREAMRNETAGARLTYLCHLLWKNRQPFCPINGCLIYLPYAIFKNGSAEEIDGVRRALDADLKILQRRLRIRCAVTIFVGGMEEDAGFLKMAQRIGAERSKKHRYGKGFPLWIAPSPQQLQSLAEHACRSFERTLFELFNAPGGLIEASNRKLFRMLCRIRGNVYDGLSDILPVSFASDAQRAAAGEDPFMFAGCYFGASGEASERQAFVASVFQKVVEHENDLEWLPSVAAEDERYLTLSRLLFVLSGLLGAAALALALMLLAP